MGHPSQPTNQPIEETMKRQIGLYGQKFLLIIEIDGEQISIYSDSKKALKKLVKDKTQKALSFEVQGVEYWKNNHDEYVECSLGSNSMISFSYWFDNYNDTHGE